MDKTVGIPKLERQHYSIDVMINDVIFYGHLFINRKGNKYNLQVKDKNGFVVVEVINKKIKHNELSDTWCDEIISGIKERFKTIEIEL